VRLKKILGEEAELLRVIGQEFREIRDGLRRRPPLRDPARDEGPALEDLIVDERWWSPSPTRVHQRNPISLYRTQRRGGAEGRHGDEGGGFRLDASSSLDAHLRLFFSDQGRCTG